jgi:hypothetical protein
VLDQIANQSRSSSGATFGQAARHTPSWHRSAVRRVDPAPVRVVPDAMPALLASGGDIEQDITALLALLQRLADQGAVLPLCAGLAEALGAEWHRGVASVVHNRMRVMRARRLIEWCYGNSHPWRGEMVVRLVETGQVLRTARAPLDWALPE